MNVLILPKRTLFICDTYVNFDPTAEQVAEMTVLAAEEIRRFGITPRVALLRTPNFGTSDRPTAVKMRRRWKLASAGGRRISRSRARCTATRRCPRTCAATPSRAPRLKGEANLRSCRPWTRPTSPSTCSRPLPPTASRSAPSCSAAPARSAILTPSATVRRIVNMTALTVVEANAQRMLSPRSAGGYTCLARPRGEAGEGRAG